jgi:SAM-dependent methyltransferase
MKIADLLLNYKTDKNYGSVKNIYKCLDTWEIIENPYPMIGHTYGSSYDEIFERFNKTKEINILEIGIQRGGSLCAWKDYFVNSNIFGIDIIDVVLPEYRREDFVYIFKDIKDLTIKEDIKDIMFDIIIDDGSHYLDDVLFVVDNYLEKLNKNGVLVIEDAQEPERWVDKIKNKISSEYELSTRDLRRDTPYSSGDNYLIVIKRI